jgi:hypothetical protein
VIFYVSNNNVTAWSDRNPARVYAHSRTHASCKRSAAAARECRDDAERSYEPNTVVVPVGHNDNFTSGDYGHSSRAIKTSICANAIHECTITAAGECCHNAAGVGYESDPIVAAVGHNNGAARKNYCNSVWV